jgi:hypothetical protein
MSPFEFPAIGFILGFVIIVWLGSIIARPILGVRAHTHDLIGATAAIGIYSLYMTLIGMLGGLKYAGAWTGGVFLVVAAWFLIYRARWWRKDRPKPNLNLWIPHDWPSRILALLLIVFQLGMLLNAFAPFINYDVYHYLFVRDYLQSGRIAVQPENAFSYYPQALEMAVATAFSRGGPEAANLCFWLMQLLLMLWLIDWCARLGRPRVGYLLATAVGGIYYWPVIAYSGYVDGGVALFCIAGVLTYLDWLQRRDKPIVSRPEPRSKTLTPFFRMQQSGFTELALAGFFLGTACASKYSALPVAALVVLHVLWLLIVDKTHRTRTLYSTLGFIVLMLIPTLPWYGRNLIVTGNPAFPFLRSVLGGPRPTLADDVAIWSSWGLPRTPLNYVIYPLKLALFYPLANAPFVRVPYAYMTWLFALAPIAGVLLIYRRLARIVAIWCFLFFSFAFLAMNLQTRYFLTFTILALWLVVEWLETFASVSPATELVDSPPTPRRTRGIAKWVVMLILLIPFATQLDLVRNHLITRRPYLSGKMSRHEYMERIWPSLAVFDRANELGRDDAKICIFSLLTYYLTVPHVLPETSVFDPAVSPDQMIERLKGERVGYVMVESRVRRAGVLFLWLVENSTSGERQSVFDEQQLLDAVGQMDFSRNLARELLKTQGGKLLQTDDGRRQWSINLDKFRQPAMVGMLKFLAAIPEMQRESRMTLVQSSDEWELYSVD